ncbi:MAG: hypothetical protein ABFD80_11110 [Acidobacteriota bacterium]
MVATETVRTIFMVLFGLSVVWVIACVIRNDMATIVRALIVLVLTGVSFYYLNQTKLTTLSFKAVKNDLFPAKPLHLVFEKRERVVAGEAQTMYIFAEPGPELVLSMEEGGRSLAVTDVDPLNRVLDYVGLPPVKTGARELASVTGSSLDVDKYRWDDYELGSLIIERSICRNITTTNTYPCIQAITVIRR